MMEYLGKLIWLSIAGFTVYALYCVYATWSLGRFVGIFG